MKQFKPSLLTLSLFAAGLTMLSAPGHVWAEEADAAQTEAEKKEQAKKENPIESIEVRGFRGSVIKSLNTKRYSDTVVDAISADDIGGLPDVSIADALVRMPGITSVRIDGQSSELNIRGLSAGFVFSTLNGREQVSPSGGRSVQFDQFPSELIEQAQIYKSQKASLIEGGVAGTIELKTANALDNEEDTRIRFSAHGNWNEAAADNEDSGSIGHRLTASYQTKLLDDTLGVSLGYARMFQPTVSSRFVNYQFGMLTSKESQENDPENPSHLGNVYQGLNNDLLISSGFELNERGGEDTRDAFMASFNWAASDTFDLQGDIFYSDYQSQKWDRGLRVSGLNNLNQNSELLLTNPIIANNTLIGGTFSRDPNGVEDAGPFGAPSTMFVQTQADDNSTDSSLLSVGFKANWILSDALTVSFDLSHSEAEEDYKDRVIRMAMFEDSSAATPVIEDDLVMTYRLNGTKIPTVTFNQDFTDINKMMVTSAEAYPHIEENSADAFRTDFTYELDSEHFTSIDAGFRISKREYELDRGRFLYGTTDGRMRNGNYITFARDDEGNLIEVVRYQPFQLTSDMATATTIGGDLSGMPGFLAIDNGQVLNAWIPGVDRTPINRWDHSWTMTQPSVVEEDVLAAYFQANLDTELFGLPVTGNIGLRIVDSEQKSTGLKHVGDGNGDELLDDRGVVSTSYERKTEGTDYTDYLPSLNLNFALTDNDQLRFAYAKVMARAEMKKMANSGSWSFNERDGGFFMDLDASTSPLLRPFYANQIDISYEHYFEDGEGGIVIALWNKDIENWVATVGGGEGAPAFDFAAAGIALPDVPADNQLDDLGNVISWQPGRYQRADNVADAGYIRGIEMAYTETFKDLPGAWSGLGVNLNFSYTESEIEVPSQVPGEENRLGPIEGISPRVYSATLFYDYEESFSARVSARHRAAYVGRQIAVGSDQWAYFSEETIISAQVSYNFDENLQAVVSMDNITDEPNISYFGDTSRTGTVQYFGRTLYFGINYKM